MSKNLFSKILMAHVIFFLVTDREVVWLDRQVSRTEKWLGQDRQLSRTDGPQLPIDNSKAITTTASVHQKARHPCVGGSVEVLT